VAAEYEVNIKINSDKVVTDLNKVDNKIKNLGKSATSQEKGLQSIVDKRARLMNRINEMEGKGLNVAKLRKQMGKATTEQGRKDLANAQKEFRILERNLRLEQSKLRILKAQRQGFPASPVRGVRSMMGSPAQISASGRQAADPIKGRADLVGSPAYYEAQQKAINRLARQGGASDPIKGHPNLVGSPKYFEAQQKEIDKAARQGGATNPLRGSKNLPGSPAYFDHLNREISKLARQGGASSPIRGNKDLIGSPAYYEHQRKQLEKLARRGGPSSPIGGAANIPGSPRARKAGMDRLGQVALGAGFPLLFGGGAGSVAGGALGGLTGSFGAQIGLSALGQQADQLLASTIKTAESVNSVGGALDFLRERSLFSSKETEELARKLENQGDLTGVAALVTEELNDALGPGGIQKMQDLAEQTKLAKQQWGELTTNLELLISGPLAKFLKIVNATLGIKVAQSQFARSLSTLKERDPERLRGLLPSFQGAKDPIKGGLSSLLAGPNMAAGVFDMQGLSEGALVSFTDQINDILSSGVKATEVPITEEDRKRFRSGSSKQELEVKKAAKRLKESQERIRLLEIEATKIKDITQFKDRIAQAELDGDKQLVIRIGLEERIAEINARKDVAMEKLTGRDLPLEQQLREQIAITSAADAREAEAKAEAVRELAVIQRDEDQRRMDAMKKHIEQQYELNTAVKQQLALADGISNVMGQGMTQAFDLLIDGADSWGNALRDIAANVLRDIAKQLIQIYIIEQSIGFIKSLMTPFNPSTPLGFGGGQTGRFGTLGPNYGIAQFADGGNPPVGKPSLVGERGPELFVPRSAGTIIPNHAMGGGASVTVNVDASGSSVEGDGNQAAQLGKAIGIAVQQELIKQKRPGGLLSR